MTKPRFDNNSTEFGLWLRNQETLDSSNGFIATNLDYIWCNYKTGKWMLVEEKRHSGSIKFYQQNMFDRIDKLCKADNQYCGFHKLIFENTSPDNGKIWLDEKNISKEDLINFLSFKGVKL